MNRFWGILKKDIAIAKKSLISPLWIIAITYVVILIMGIIGYVKTGSIKIQLNNFNVTGMLGNTLYFIVFFANAVAVAYPGLICSIKAISLSQNALNSDIQNKCEIFYRTQPISIWKRSLSKYLVSIFGVIAVLFSICLVNLIIINSILYFIFKEFLFLVAWHGMMINFVGFSLIIIVLGSLLFLASSIFKEKAFGRTILVLVLTTGFIEILNLMLNLNILTPIELVRDFLFFGITSFKIENIENMPLENLVQIINKSWDIILSFQTLIKLLISGAIFILSTFIYKWKEIK